MQNLKLLWKKLTQEILKQQGSVLSRRMHILLKGYRDVEIKNEESLRVELVQSLWNLDQFKFANILDRQKKKRKMLINETKSGVSALAEMQLVPSQRDASLNSSNNVMNTLSQGEKIDNKSNEMVDRTEAAGKPTYNTNINSQVFAKVS